MIVNEIKKELDSIESEFEKIYNCDINSDVKEFANNEVNRLVKKYDIKESQAMFIVMAAINNFLKI